MNIFSYLRSRGIDMVDPSFYRKIEEWKSWYNANVRGFSTYKVFTGNGTYTKRRRKSLGMAKKLSEDIADLLLNERVKITVSDKTTDEYVKSVLDNNNFLVLANDYQERKAYTGTVAYIPYLDEIETDADGFIISGKININYVSASNIFPISWFNGNVTECIFMFPKTINRKKYVHLQWHKLENGQYVIENTVLECISGSREGKELSPDEWRRLKPFEKMVKRMETGSAQPQFVLDKLNIVNNASEDESNPMGVAIFANAIDIMKKLDIEFDSYSNEFELGRKRIFVAPEIMRNRDGTLAFDPEDTIFYKLPEDYADKDDKGMIHEVDLNIRSESHSRAINDDLNYLSLKCGFGTEHYKFEGGQVKTATEVISANSDMYRMIEKHEILLDSVLKNLIRIIIRLGIVLKNNLNEQTEITITFDDSIIEDKTAERQQDRQDVSIGAMQLAEYRAKWYGETLEKAKAAVQQPAEVIE